MDHSRMAALVGGGGATLVSIFAARTWGVAPVLVGVGVVFVLVGVVVAFGPKDADAAERAGGAVLALGVASAPVFGVRLLGTAAEGWEAIYIAGALGGLVLELTLGQGEIELPGRCRTKGKKADGPRGALGVEVDLGVFARLFQGGLAAVVALALIAAAAAEDTSAALSGAAAEPLSIVWAIALGVASTAVWKGIQSLAEARMGAFQKTAEAASAGLDAPIAMAEAESQSLAHGIEVRGAESGATESLSHMSELLGALKATKNQLDEVSGE